MSLSVFDIFKIGIGPSSSHTMGPMNAARAFVELLDARGLLDGTAQISAQLYGSLALTGRGHCTDRAILLGLEGFNPATIDSSAVEPALRPDAAGLTLDLIELLGLSEEGFRRRFRDTALWRTRRRGLLRNAAIALGNLGDTRALPALRQAMGDSELLVREAARWSIDRLSHR